MNVLGLGFDTLGRPAPKFLGIAMALNRTIERTESFETDRANATIIATKVIVRTSSELRKTVVRTRISIREKDSTIVIFTEEGFVSRRT